MKRILALLLAVLPLPALAATLTITWTPPATCADGSPLTQCPIIKYTVYSGLSGAPKTVLTTTAPNVTTFAAKNTGPGNWCIQASASSTAGESTLTPEVCRVIAAPIVSPPSGVTLTVTADTTAVTIAKTKAALVLLPVGTIPSGTACDAAQSVSVSGANYYVINPDLVTWSGSVRTLAPLAKCS